MVSARQYRVNGVPLVARSTLTLGPLEVVDLAAGASVECRRPFPLAFAARDTASPHHVNPAGSVSNRMRVPADGRVVGWSLVSNTARTAGTVELVLGINGVAQVAPPPAMACRLNAESPVSRMIHAPRYEDGLRFFAGQEIGVFIVSSADWAPVTADCVAYLHDAFD